VLDFVAPESKARVLLDFGKVALGIDAYLVNYKLLTEKKREVWVECIGKKITFGDAAAMLVSMRDITERRILQNEVSASLKEKEILLKEIHHRVKNNMQVISSLLSLQVKQMKDTPSREAIRESQNRVMSIALVHEKLYQSKSLAAIEYHDYLKNIAENLLQSYGIPPGKVRIEIRGENIVLPIGRAIPISLMINELLSNSLKYAFPGDRKGVITVDFHREGEKEVLIVSDDGIGLPEGIDPGHTETLGLQLVNSLAGQALGTITLNRDRGTEFRIAFENEPVNGNHHD
jgi:two-component sensor histidine kinase